MNTTFDYLYLMDYSDGTICEIELTEEDDDKDIEDICREHGVSYDTCSYMYCQHKINDIIHLDKIED